MKTAPRSDKDIADALGAALHALQPLAYPLNIEHHRDASTGDLCVFVNGHAFRVPPERRLELLYESDIRQALTESTIRPSLANGPLKPTAPDVFMQQLFEGMRD